MKILSARSVLPIVSPPIERGAVVVDEGKIVEVDDRRKIVQKYPHATIEEYPLLMPGLVNAHTQLDLYNFPERSAQSLFFQHLIETWGYRAGLSPADRRRALREGARQLLRQGTTCAGDVGSYAGCLEEIEHMPLRMVLFSEISSTDSGGYESVFNQIEEVHRLGSKRLSPGIAPYSAFTLSRHLLKIVAEQARRLEIPLKIHAAETFAEMQFFFESTGEIADILFPALGWKDRKLPELRKTPIQYLESVGFLEAKPTLVGGNHLADSDLRTISRLGLTLISCPRWHDQFKLGLPPFKKLAEMGISVALGTDGRASAHPLSLWDEMRFIQGESSPPELLRMATLSGAKALGQEKRIGSLEAGKEADLIAIKIPQNLSLPDAPSWLVSNVTDREIEAVFVGGEKIS